MEFTVTCFPNESIVEVTKREIGENCQAVRQVMGGKIIDDETTGPDCDEVHEIVS